ncbi:MAG: MFS transporter [Acidobacteria bacterium]|nr:MAG: MFS transporter [Acidobacteriota bacterium]PYQ22221.1 MAG: MFS transporter [Acidobacteriota bacterium]
MPRAPLEHTVRALRHRNFRLFLGGQIISLAGTWMQQVALSWLVYRLTRSAFLLGLVGFTGQLPSLLLAPLAGVWADLGNRRRIVIGTQALSMLQALGLAALVFSGRITIGHVLVLSVFIGLVNGVDVPTRQAFLVEMVRGREDLANAIALNSSVFNAARLVGPAVAGLMIGLVGEGMVFLLNGLSYVAVIAALFAMEIEPRPRAAHHAQPVLRNLEEGFRYAFGFAPIRSLLLLIGLVSLMGVPFTVLMPIFATDVLHGGAHTLGFLMSALGVGALGGALYLAQRRSVRGLGQVIAAAVTLFGLALIVFGLSRHEWLSLVVLAGAGFGMMVQMASSNTILQTIVDEHMRGRVMSFYSMAFMGTLPLGSLLAGGLASRAGAPSTVVLGGLACLLGAAAFARALPTLRAQIRPIYARMGIIPEVAAGLQTAEMPTPPRE